MPPKDKIAPPERFSDAADYAILPLSSPASPPTATTATTRTTTTTAAAADESVAQGPVTPSPVRRRPFLSPATSAYPQTPQQKHNRPPFTDTINNAPQQRELTPAPWSYHSHPRPLHMTSKAPEAYLYHRAIQADERATQLGQERLPLENGQREGPAQGQASGQYRDRVQTSARIVIFVLFWSLVLSLVRNLVAWVKWLLDWYCDCSSK